MNPALPRRRRAARVAAAGLLGATVAAGGGAGPAASGLLDFGADETARILQHGPWPPAAAADPGNALARSPAAQALGRQLFFDPRLSRDGRLSCASCHLPARAFTDGRPRALGRAPDGQVGGPGATLARNTPTLWNAGQQRWLGWDGAFDSLWSQALHPLLNPQEMAADPPAVQALLRTDPTLACLWQRAHGAPAGDDTAQVLVQLAKALGAWVGSLQSGPTPFDAFRDALARQDTAAAARYPLAAQRGLRLFIGRGQCATCHAGPLFTHGEFGDIGARFFVRPGVVDPGRHGGISALLANPHNLLGRWADPPPPGTDPAWKTRHVQAQHRHFGEFKVPGLRNVARTGPYLHDGQLATLDEVLDHYARLDPDRLHADGEQILRPLPLSPGERADLLAFLRSLSDDTPAPLPPPAAACGPG